MFTKDRFVKILNWIEDLFMTNHSCLVCYREIVDGTKFQVCENCKNDIHVMSGSLCEKCGDEIVDGNRFCDHCKVSVFNFEQNRSYCYYDEAAAKIVKGLKYGHRRYYAKHIAEMLASVDGYFEDVEVITYVPINNKRKRERGFNQAEEIAKELSEILGIKVLNLLEKDENSKHQAGLTQKERLQNLIGSFSINAENSSEVKNKTVLVIDDVFTTGATLNECCHVLKRCKPKKLKTLTFAKTRFGK